MDSEYCLTDEEYSALVDFIAGRVEDIEFGLEDLGKLKPLLSILEPRSSVVEFF